MLRCVWLVLISICLVPAHAQDVSLKPGALTLNANLEKAADWPQRVALMTHGTFAFSRAEIMADLQQAFKKQGLSSLAINISYAMTTAPVSHTTAQCRVVTNIPTASTKSAYGWGGSNSKAPRKSSYSATRAAAIKARGWRRNAMTQAFKN